MKKSEYVFNGNWEYEIELPELVGFQSDERYKATSNCLLKIEFEDDLTDNPDPYEPQTNTLNYIFENTQKIVDSIVRKTIEEMPEIIINYDLQSEEAYLNLNYEKVKPIVSLHVIRILIESKDGFSYFDVSGGCNWDEEHGLNILFHKDRAISFGGIDGGSYWDALKDNGTYEEVNARKTEKTVPRKHTAHPKYNKLKPSQKSENDYYECSLISGGFNQEFIRGVENGEIDINGKYENQNKTYLETACWFNNNEIVAYLLSKKAEIRYALHQCIGYNNNPVAMELLLKHGADINFQFGSTVLYELISSLERKYSSRDYYKSINHELTEAFLNEVIDLKNRIKHLIKIGADPSIRNSYQFNCFDIMRNSSEENRKEVADFLKKCLKEK